MIRTEGVFGTRVSEDFVIMRLWDSCVGGFCDHARHSSVKAKKLINQLIC